MNLVRASKFFLILGAVSLIFRKGQFLESFLPKPFEVFLLFALITTLLYFLLSKNWSKLKIIPKEIYLLPLVFILSAGLATLVSYFKYGVSFNTEGILNVGRILVIVIAFLLISFYLREDKLFYKRLCLALLAPLIFIPFLILPELTYQFSIVGDDGRLYGFDEFPSLMAASSIVALAILFALFFENYYSSGADILSKARYSSRADISSKARYKIHQFLPIVYFFLTAAVAALIFWTQSRGAWLGMIGVLLIIPILTGFSFFKKNIIKHLLISSFLIVLILIIGFLILPSSAKTVVILRIFPQYTHQYISKLHQPDARLFSQQDLSDLITEITKKPSFQAIGEGITYSQPRFTLWTAYSKLIPKNPLGLGINYFPDLAVKINDNSPRGPYNTILEFWVWGGIGALIAIFFLIWKIILNIKIKLKTRPDFWTIGVVAALFGLSIFAFFDNMSIHKIIWILLAMALI